MGIFDKFKSNKIEFSFKEDPNLATFTCIHVMSKEKPILYVSHDEDGDWQFLCGDNHTTDEARIISLYEAYKLDNSISKLANMKFGKIAERTDAQSDWKIKARN